MRGFDPIALTASALKIEVAEFDAFLNSSETLKERDQIAPFFKQHKNLVAGIGLTHSDVQMPNRVSTELDLFGDFTCDAASGDDQTNAYLLIEFEDAKKGSVMKKAGPGKIRPWSSRFEHGTSQIIDWAWRLHSEAQGSISFRRIFGANVPARRQSG